MLSRSLPPVVLVVLMGCGGGESIDQLANGNTFPDASGDAAADAKLDSSTVPSEDTEDAPDAARSNIGDAASEQFAAQVEAGRGEAAPDASSVDAGKDVSVLDAGPGSADCGSDACGSIGIVINVCPQIQGFTFNPVNVAVGEVVHLTSNATDDNGDVLTFLWTANQGVFSAASSPSSDYHCSMPGTATLTLTVSDGKCEDGIDQDIVCH